MLVVQSPVFQTVQSEIVTPYPLQILNIMRNSEKFKEQIGLSVSTARNRLIKLLVSKMLDERGEVCFRCGKPLNGDWTIDHVENWLDSDDPVALFFDVENVAYSHHACNSRHTRNYSGVEMTENERKRAWEKENRVYDPEKRRNQYLRTGK